MTSRIHIHTFKMKKVLPHAETKACNLCYFFLENGRDTALSRRGKTRLFVFYEQIKRSF